MPPAPIGAVISYGPRRVPSLNNIGVNAGRSLRPEPPCRRGGGAGHGCRLKLTATRRGQGAAKRGLDQVQASAQQAGVRCRSRMSRGRAASYAIVFAALAFRLALALALPNDESDDGRLYALIAHNIGSHAVYSASEDPPYRPTYIRVPGYPLFLAAVYGAFGEGNNTAVRVVQACLDTGTCCLVAL